MRNTLKITKNIMNKYNIRANKRFGQNFLIDDNVLEDIVKSSNINKEDLVIEIGPGLGNLTEYILENAKYTILVEIDKNMIDILNDRFKNQNNYILLNQDILKINLEEYIKNIEIEKNMKFKSVKVVANLPYYITTPIILGLLSQTNKISRYVMMMQLEVADRICGKPKTKDYNALSIAIMYRATATKVIKVPRTVFIPAPNVDSAVVRLDLYDNPKYICKDEKHFFDFIRECFSQRRKTLVNNLSNKYSKDFIVKMLNENNIKLTARAEELDITDFIKLSDYIVVNQ